MGGHAVPESPRGSDLRSCPSVVYFRRPAGLPAGESRARCRSRIRGAPVHNTFALLLWSFPSAARRRRGATGRRLGRRGCGRGPGWERTGPATALARRAPGARRRRPLFGCGRRGAVFGPAAANRLDRCRPQACFCPPFACELRLPPPGPPRPGRGRPLRAGTACLLGGGQANLAGAALQTVRAASAGRRGSREPRPSSPRRREGARGRGLGRGIDTPSPRTFLTDSELERSNALRNSFDVFPWKEPEPAGSIEASACIDPARHRRTSLSGRKSFSAGRAGN